MVRDFPVEDRLDGASNYGSWKPRVLLALEGHDVMDLAVKEVPMPKEEPPIKTSSSKDFDDKIEEMTQLIKSLTNKIT